MGRRPATPEFLKQLGKRLTIARQKMPGGELTQKQVAERLKIRHQTIGDWEAGQNISASELANLCRTYDVSADRLLGLDDSGPELGSARRVRRDALRLVEALDAWIGKQPKDECARGEQESET